MYDGPDGGNSASPRSGSDDRSSIADQLREQASSRLGGQKDRAVAGLTSIADAVRQAGQKLRETDRGGVADYVEGAADQAARFAERMRHKDVREIVSDVERFARRQPAAFLGLSFGIGLLGARFLKSTPPRHPAAPRGLGGSDGRFGAGQERSYAAGARPSWTNTTAGSGAARPGMTTRENPSQSAGQRYGSSAVTPSPDDIAVGTAGPSRSRTGRGGLSEP